MRMPRFGPQAMKMVWPIAWYIGTKHIQFLMTPVSFDLVFNPQSIKLESNSGEETWETYAFFVLSS